ncbi:MAG TPA: DMT family transporter [Actinomycetota bacterium]|nr:DMT family transporter [Actinomycetota bacterium]
MVFALSLLAALSFALAAVLHQRAAARAPEHAGTRVPVLTWLFRRPIWLGGTFFMLFGYALQAVALSFGSLVTVEGLLTTNLVFALPIASAWGGRRMRPIEWAAMVATTGGLVLFLVMRGPPAAGGDPSATRWLYTFGAAAVLVAAAHAITLRSPPAIRALVLGAAAGVAFGLADGLTKALVPIFEQRRLGGFLSWQLYLVGIWGGGGLIVSQAAYHVAALRDSFPAMNVAEPLAGAALGVLLFSESLPTGAPAIALDAVAIVIMLAGVVALARSDLIVGAPHGPRSDPSGSR